MRIGIDLGGTKIEGIALDDSGAELVRQRIGTPQGDYRATIDAIFTLVQLLEADTQQTGTIGIGIPGAISPASGLVKNANSTWLIGKPIQTDLEQVLSRPVRIANDANCFVVSEATDGAANGPRSIFVRRPTTANTASRSTAPMIVHAHRGSTSHSAHSGSWILSRAVRHNSANRDFEAAGGGIG